MVYSITFFDNQTPHPGFYTLVPVLGVALVIGFASQGDLIGKILGSKPSVWVGLISYSAYLWHFPIFAFSRMGGTPDRGDKIGWIVLTFVLSIISFWVIERPFRRRDAVSLKAFLVSVSVCVVAIGSFMSYSISTNGLEDYSFWNYRYTKIQRALMSDFDRGEWEKLTDPAGVSCWNRDPSNACRVGDQKIVFLGDSYTGAFQRGFVDVLKRGFVTLTNKACPFVSDQFFIGEGEVCADLYKKKYQIIGEFTDPKIVILSGNEYTFSSAWRREKDPDTGKIVRTPVHDSLVWTTYSEQVNWLVSKGHKVVLIRTIPVPNLEQDGATWLGANRQYIEKMDFPNLFNNTGPSGLKEYDDRRYGTFDPEAVLVIDPSDALCDLEKNRCWDVKENYGPLYNGFRHLSYLGSTLLGEHVKERLVEVGWIAE